jgi:hypothetical protein
MNELNLSVGSYILLIKLAAILPKNNQNRYQLQLFSFYLGLIKVIAC